MADDAKEEGSGGLSGKRVIGSVAAMILAIGAGIIKHADDFIRPVARHADEFARPLGRHAGGLAEPVARNPEELARPGIRRAGQLADVVDRGAYLGRVVADSGDAGVDGVRRADEGGKGVDLDETLRALGQHTERSLRQRASGVEGAPADPGCDPQPADDADAVPAPAEDEAEAKAHFPGPGPAPDAAAER